MQVSALPRAPIATRRHCYLTRWLRRLAFGLVIALILLGLLRAWRAMHPAPVLRLTTLLT